ncbi:hypothetical protein ACFVRE_43355, partial [Streptomyces sp. NPDC057910]
RFTTRDTAPLHNRYQYADTNPITNTDPTGQTAVYDTARSGILIGIAVITALITAAVTAATGGIGLGIALAGAVLDTASAALESAALMSGNNQWDSPLNIAAYTLGAAGLTLGVGAVVAQLSKGIGKTTQNLTKAAYKVIRGPEINYSKKEFRGAGAGSFGDRWKELKELNSEMGKLPAGKEIIHESSMSSGVSFRAELQVVKFEFLKRKEREIFLAIEEARKVRYSASGARVDTMIKNSSVLSIEGALESAIDGTTGLSVKQLRIMEEAARRIEERGILTLTGQEGRSVAPLRPTWLQRGGVVVGNNDDIMRNDLVVMPAKFLAE